MSDRGERQKAWKLVRATWSGWQAFKDAGGLRTGVQPVQAVRAARLLSTVSKAETATLRIACAVPDDLAARIAYGEMAAIRSSLLATVGGKPGINTSIDAARRALWGLYGAELAGGQLERLELLADSRRITTDFTPNGEPAEIDGEARVLAAANVRLTLAETLARRTTKQLENPMTPDQLDANLRTRDKIHITDETLLSTCQLASCFRYDPADKVMILVLEARRTFQYVATLGGTFTPDALATAESRCDAIHHRLRNP